MPERNVEDFIKKCLFHEEDLIVNDEDFSFKTNNKFNFKFQKFALIYEKFKNLDNLPLIFARPLGFLYQNKIYYAIKSTSVVNIPSLKFGNISFSVNTMPYLNEIDENSIIDQFISFFLKDTNIMKDKYLVVDNFDPIGKIDPIKIAYLLQLNSNFFDYEINFYGPLDNTAIYLKDFNPYPQKIPVTEITNLYYVPPLIFQYYFQALSDFNPINLKFLCLYNIIEYFIELVYKDKYTSYIKKKIIGLITNMNNMERIDRGVSEITQYIHNYFPRDVSLPERLELVLEKFIDFDELFDKFERISNITINKTVFEEINRNSKNKISLLRKRIYGLRNSIVHSNPFSSSSKPINIFTHGQIIASELPLMFYIAETIIKKFKIFYGVLD